MQAGFPKVAQLASAEPGSETAKRPASHTAAHARARADEGLGCRDAKGRELRWLRATVAPASMHDLDPLINGSAAAAKPCEYAAYSPDGGLAGASQSSSLGALTTIARAFWGNSHRGGSAQPGRKRMPTIRALFAAALLVIPSSAFATFSIVARDSTTGDIGVAVQSHYFSVGPIVPWAEPGIGAVATQSLVEVSYGPKGLDLMRDGRTADQALRELLGQDPHPEVRQVAMVDSHGNVAAHTGPKCIPDAGDHQGAGYSVQANLMSNKNIWPAMAKAYENAKGDLAEHLLEALEAGQ